MGAEDQNLGVHTAAAYPAEQRGLRLDSNLLPALGSSCKPQSTQQGWRDGFGSEPMLRTHSSECREPVSMGCDFLVISVEREITIKSKPSEATLGRRTDKHTQGHTY